MDFIVPQRRIKSGKPGNKKPDADSGKKITELFHTGLVNISYKITIRV